MKKKNKLEIAPIKESRPYVLWRRVSTQEQGVSGLGLEAQLTIAKLFMGKEPVQVFTDVFSGTKLKQCKGLQEAIQLCNSENYLLVIAKTDRCRNVQEALEIVDAVGERNLIFCDVPSSDRFVLTVLFAMFERQAIIGRLNTRIALAERKKQIEENGGFTSKSGHWRTRLGNKPGTCYAQAITAMAIRRTEKARDWKRNSPLYTWLTIQVLRDRTQDEILADAEALYEKNPEKYCTQTGNPLRRTTYLKWRRNILKGHDI